MILNKWSPVFAAEVEAGAEPASPEPSAPPPRIPINETPSDGPGSGRSQLRKQLEKNFEEDRKTRDSGEREEARPKKQVSSARRALQDQEKEVEREEGEQPEARQQEGEVQELAAPEGFAKEAAAEWAKTPPAVQAAIHKRIQDMNNGVAQLRQRYADIDKALQPRAEMLRQFQKSPAEAVDQLFLWFEALQGNPYEAFPALAKSFKFDLRQLLQPQGQQPQQQPQQEATPPASLP